MQALHSLESGSGPQIPNQNKEAKQGPTPQIPNQYIPPEHAEGPEFDNIEVYGQKGLECSDDLPGSLFTTGPVAFECRITQLAHLQRAGGNNSGPYKFIGKACGRGDDDMLARHAAFSRAQEAVLDLEGDAARELGADPNKNEMFRNDAAAEHCVKTGDTRASK
jgi:hypothetical protein